MRTRTVLTLTLAVLAATIASPVAAVWLPSPVVPSERPEYVPGELILEFRPDLPEAARQGFLAEQGLTVLRSYRVTGAQLVRLPAGALVEQQAAALAARDEILYADPNYYRYIDGIPNDARFDELWGMHNTGQTGGTPDADIDAPQAWEVTVGSDEVVVAVLDSGMDHLHEDLSANLYINPGEIPNDGIDNDGNGYVDDVRGWDFRDNDNDPSPSGQGCVGHGTHTSGTVGAVGNNGVGVTGVSQKVKLMPLRAFYPFLFILCTAQDADLLEAVEYMGIMGVDVSNNSWGGGGFSQSMYNAIAAGRHLFVASAGNNGTDNDASPAYPASYDLDNVVAVASTTDTDALSSFSNFGLTSVDLGAPGSGILSTKPNNAYGLLDGTSMASPHVAGAAVLLLAADPTATPLELKNRLLRGADPIGIPVVTRGRLNIASSLALPAASVSVDVEPVGGTMIPPGGTMTYDLTLTNQGAQSETVTVSVRIWAPNGKEVKIAGPVSLTLAAGQVKMVTLSKTLPGGAPVGDYWLIGQATNNTDSFDEDLVVYQVR